ncbi:bifunctional adenosylcobinamide kinase/adenosylcobinamide-phosphate guanylyltransferase [Dongia sp.]|jgi:adenosylcobinamide kinase/adenosylcobinamide-phosphate guanylyltransferase|uniref:bifunctional adenosylcobinamide kinase/adenosylcobinamide-phosphate guanylyltransferase n=1 Tax=Dongia sp. TaxID=1977262 RepID=UPI0035AFD592
MARSLSHGTGLTGLITPLPAITLVLGGARSGKSRYAEEVLDRHTGARTYIATAEIRDDEMAARVKLHQSRRDPDWRLVEEPLELAQAIVAETEKGAAVLVDCLTLWLTNVMLAERDVVAQCDALETALGQCGGPLIFVANEVGLGIVPDNKLARDFRDAAGRLNQRIAACADHVLFVAAGLPLILK